MASLTTDGRRDWTPELLAAGCATAWFLYLGYGPTLNPTFVQWMLRDDWSTYYWGFAFFRNAAWSWPLGAIDGLFFPHGSSVAFMDANPWLAVLLKPLSPLLPRHFQYHGLWLYLCFVLQGVLGARLCAAFTTDRVQRGLGGALLALTPILPVRHVHIALCGLFFITGMLALAMRPGADGRDTRRRIGWSLLLVGWAAGTHGYLSAMTLSLSLALYLQLWLCERRLRVAQWAAASAGAVGLSVLVYALFGLIGWQATDLTAEGFGQFSADLLALLNPQGWSRVVPAIALQPRQHEGFAYLGLGVLGLLGLGAVQLARTPGVARGAMRAHWPLWLSVIGMAIYALSSTVTVAGHTWLSLDALYAPLSTLTGIFRSSGRFMWPLHVLLAALSVAAAARLPRMWLGRGLLLLAVVVQAAEFAPRHIHFRPTRLQPIDHPALAGLGRDYAHLRTVPLHLLWVCRYDRAHVDRLMGLAYRERMTFNSGNYMRKSPHPKRLCNQHVPGDAPLDHDTVYVVDRDFRSDFLGRDDARCGRIDGLQLCVAARRRTRLSHALERQSL